MRKPLIVFVFLASILLAGLIGFSMATVDLPRMESTAAIQLDVDLSMPMATSLAPTLLMSATPTATLLKTHETEPEEVPAVEEIKVEIVSRDKAHDKPLRVLIYHTHTYEAYEPDYPNQYKPTERWRTADASYNVVSIGAALAKTLREDYGMEVVHDVTAFEPPNLDSAYQRSLEAIEGYTARGETFDLYIDLHRDAYVEGRYPSNTLLIDGKNVARMMFLVGKGTGAVNGQNFAQKPKWEENYLRADVITECINFYNENLCRPVSTRSSRYNQHISTGALLVEIGNNMNSLEEALATVPYLARAIAQTNGGDDIKIQYPVVSE